MTKQEEIREGIEGKLEEVFAELDHWDCSEECGHKVALIEWKDELTSEILNYLHSQGVVIQTENGGDLTGCCLAKLESLIKEG